MQTLLQSTQAYRLLKTEIEGSQRGHAYLLLFADGRNLRCAAKTFAQLFFSPNGENPRAEDLIEREIFSDCLFFPQDEKKLTVEDAEKIQEECTLSPVEGDTKVFVVGDFSEANVQTQNKLLKLLEEPPQGVVFLLCATNVYPILTTVLSRVKRLEIQPFSVDEVNEYLHRKYGESHDENTLSVCAATSNGIVGEAQNALEGGYYQTLTEAAFALAGEPRTQIPLTVKQIGETKYKKELLNILRLIFRDMLILKTQSKKAERQLLLKGEKERLVSIAEKYTVNGLLYAQTAITEAEKQVRFNAVFPQCIELCMIKIRENNK